MDQRDIDRALVAMGGRPTNSSGWGMLKATRSGTFVSERDPTEGVTLTEGVSRVNPRHWIVSERPELFRVVDKRDVHTAQTHSRYLERSREELERGRTSTRARTPYRPGVLSRGVLPPRPHRNVLPAKAAPWRLPR